MADREDLLAIRNQILNQKIGACLLAYLQDYVTDMACKNLDAMEVKGMCRLIQQIKTIPQQLENERKH